MKERALAAFTIGNKNKGIFPVRFTKNTLLSMPEHDTHPTFEITVFLTSEGTYSINGRDFDFKCGDVFIMPPNAPHAVSNITKEGVIYNLTFEGDFVVNHKIYDEDNCLRVFSGNAANFKNRLDRTNPVLAEIIMLMDKIYDEFSMKNPGFENMVRIYIQTILVNIYRNFDYGKEQELTKPRNIILLEKSIDYINEHFTDDISLDELAEIAGFTPTYYGIIFKKINGITPWEYVTAKRISYAISLLGSGEYSSILELATKCGFNNSANFNRTFKKYTGFVPSQYLRNI